MATKTPRPFWRKSKEAWYVQLRDGRQKQLGKHPEGEPPPKKNKNGEWNPPDAVMKEYHRVMLHDDAGAAPRKRHTVEEVFDLYLDYCQRETVSYDEYKFFLIDAAKAFGRLPVLKLKPFHVRRWLRRHTSWGDTTRHMVITIIKAALNHAVDEGHIRRNPLRKMRMPTPNVRERVLTPEERQQIFDAVKDRRFADYLLALSESGARPGEVSNLTPEDVNADLGVWILKKHKTRKKTGRTRVVYLTPALLELTKRLLKDAEPGKPLFRNRLGNAWCNNSLYYRFETLRKKFPHLHDVVPYTFRASFATDALEKGVPEATVAELLGHRGTRMLEKHYNKLSQKVQHLRDSAARAAEGRPQ